MASGAAKMLEAPSCAFQIGTIRAPIPSLVFGKARARRAATVAASALACERLPDLSLTLALNCRALRSRSPASGAGTQASSAIPGKSPWNSAGSLWHRGLLFSNCRNVALYAAYYQMSDLALRVQDKLNHHPWTASEGGFR